MRTDHCDHKGEGDYVERDDVTMESNVVCITRTWSLYSYCHKTTIKNYYLGVNTPNTRIRQHFVPVNPPIFQQALLAVPSCNCNIRVENMGLNDLASWTYFHRACFRCQVLGADHKSFSESIKISPSLCHHVILRLRPNPVSVNGEKTGWWVLYDFPRSSRKKIN